MTFSHPILQLSKIWSAECWTRTQQQGSPSMRSFLTHGWQVCARKYLISYLTWKGSSQSVARVQSTFVKNCRTSINAITTQSSTNTLRTAEIPRLTISGNLKRMLVLAATQVSAPLGMVLRWTTLIWEVNTGKIHFPPTCLTQTFLDSNSHPLKGLALVYLAIARAV